ncbi:MFS transporter [Kocuria dechangensis]|nr:MFS transporter [Kocuria dechangensis]
MNAHPSLTPAADEQLPPLPSRSSLRPPARAADTGEPSGRTLDWRTGGLMMAVTFSLLQMLNEIGTLMAIPLYGSMSAELGLTPNQVSWALLATTLCGASTIAVLAKAGDIFGHRRLMIWCVLGITVGYVVSALAPSFTVLLIGRFLTGVMAGQALCVGIMRDRLSAVDRKKAVAVIAAGQAAGVFLGFGLGGLFVVLGLTWRITFVVGALLTLISLVAFLRWGDDSDAGRRHSGSARSLDVVGVVLMGLGLTALCVGISQSMVWGPTSFATVATVGLGVALLVGSLAWEARSSRPLVDISEMFSARLLPAYAVFLTMGITGMLMFNLVMGWAMLPAAAIGYGFGLNPLLAGFLFIPMTVAGAVAARLVSRLLVRVPARNVVLGSALLLGADFVFLRFWHDSLITVLVAVFVYGLAYTSLLTTAVSVIAVEAHEDRAAGTASVYVALALAASSIGAAIYSALMGWGTDPVTMLPTPETFDVGFLVAAAASVFAIGSGLTLSKQVRLSRIQAH